MVWDEERVFANSMHCYWEYLVLHIYVFKQCINKQWGINDLYCGICVWIYFRSPMMEYNLIVHVWDCILGLLTLIASSVFISHWPLNSRSNRISHTANKRLDHCLRLGLLWHFIFESFDMSRLVLSLRSCSTLTGFIRHSKKRAGFA